jgi:hypothetical protein
LKPAHTPLEWKVTDQEDPVNFNGETVQDNTTSEINSSALAAIRAIQEETGNKPKHSTGMRKECGTQGEENLMDGRNTSQGNRDIKSTQNNNRKSEEWLNQIEDKASSDNNGDKNEEDGVLLQTSYTTLQATTGVRPSTRPKKLPNTMLKDFLW